MHDIAKIASRTELTLFVSSFRSRASRLRLTAFAILGIIFGLLVGGAAAFVFAPQITLSDFYPQDLDKKIKDLDEEKQRLEKPNKDSRDAILSWQSEWQSPIQSAYRTYEATLAHFGQRSAVRVPAKPDIDIDDGNVGAKQVVISKIQQFNKEQEFVKFHLINPPGIPEVYYDIPSKSLPEVVSSLSAANIHNIPPAPKSIDIDASTKERLNLLDLALGQLQKEKTERGLAAIVGRGSPPANTPNGPHAEGSKVASDVPLAQLIQTNVTRFGTIIMITFLVSILTPLYRYNIRLATFYDARGDALELFDSKLKNVGFARLTTVLTPALDFGKTPNTPFEQMMELAHQFSGGRTSRKKDEA